MTEHTDPTDAQHSGPEQAPDAPDHDPGRGGRSAEPTDSSDSNAPGESTEGGERRPRVVMSSPEGVSMADPSEDPTAAVEEPAKVMRIGQMLKQLLEEVKSAPLDEAARDRLAEVHERSIAELRTGLSPELADELERISLPFSDDATPSDAELRVAQAQLVGWLEGLFHGIQTALVAQQMLAQNQLASMHRALPPGAGGQGRAVVDPRALRSLQAQQGQAGGRDEHGQERPGQYL